MRRYSLDSTLQGHLIFGPQVKLHLFGQDRALAIGVRDALDSAHRAGRLSRRSHKPLKRGKRS